MSRLGKKPIVVPEKTAVSVGDGVISVKGPHGELSRSFLPKRVGIEVREEGIVLEPKGNSKESQVLWGTYSSHVRNMITGVNEPFVKKLVLEGVGYKVDMQGNDLVLSVGFSHQVKMPVPQGITVTVEKNNITISGIDKEEVGQFAAVIRAVKKPEPYKGKGIRYENEVVRRKQGKRAVT